MGLVATAGTQRVRGYDAATAAEQSMPCGEKLRPLIAGKLAEEGMGTDQVERLRSHFHDPDPLCRNLEAEVLRIPAVEAQRRLAGIDHGDARRRRGVHASEHSLVGGAGDQYSSVAPDRAYCTGIKSGMAVGGRRKPRQPQARPERVEPLAALAQSGRQPVCERCALLQQSVIKGSEAHTRTAARQA